MKSIRFTHKLLALFYLSLLALAFQNCTKPDSKDQASVITQECPSSASCDSVTTPTLGSETTTTTSPTTTTTLPTDPQYVMTVEGNTTTDSSIQNAEVIPSGTFAVASVSNDFENGANFFTSDTSGNSWQRIFNNFSPSEAAVVGDSGGSSGFTPSGAIYVAKINNSIPVGALTFGCNTCLVKSNIRSKLFIQVFKNVSTAKYSNTIIATHSASYDRMWRVNPNMNFETAAIAVVIGISNETQSTQSGFLLNGMLPLTNQKIFQSGAGPVGPPQNYYRHYVGSAFVSSELGQERNVGALLTYTPAMSAGFFRANALIYLVP